MKIFVFIFILYEKFLKLVFNLPSECSIILNYNIQMRFNYFFFFVLLVSFIVMEWQEEYFYFLYLLYMSVFYF